jgi:sugar transferase (PEP-CTERM/EpsH1 system associated)
MRILALVHRVPYPPNKGEKIRAFNELKFLSERGHAIDLGTFADIEEDLGWGEELKKYCREVAIVRKDRRLSRARSILALPRRRPLSVGYFDSYRLRRKVDAWLAEREYDLAFCYSSPMAEYVRGKRMRGKRMARVMDFVDVDSDKWRQYAAHTKQPLRSLYLFEAVALSAYERAIAEEVDASIFVSAAEAEVFRRSAPGARRVVDVPNGVDADYFGATRRRPRDGSAPLLVFVGQMDYFANVDGVCWFADEVMPLVREVLPNVEFRIVGRAPTPEVLKLADRPGITVTGAVPDVRDYLAESTLMVAPLRIARGIQNKVLEGMAARIAVVASPAAMEGIEGTVGQDALVATSPREWVDAIARLAGDAALRGAQEDSARALVTSKYAWEPAMRRLEELCVEVVDAITSRHLGASADR